MGAEMDMQAALLAGRRGRRLLYELVAASQLEQDTEGGGPAPVLGAFHDAAYLVAKERGDAVARFVAVPEGAPVTTADLEPVMPTDAELAALLGQVTLPEPSLPTVRRALAASVDAAMYWQPPDGEDTLLGRADIIPALRRLAGALGPSRPVTGWTDACARADQWSITWDDVQGLGGPGPEEPVPSAAECLARWKEQVVRENGRRRRELRRPLRKLGSGPWWSTPPFGTVRSTGRFADGTPVGLWCAEDGMGWRGAQLRRLSVPAAAPVYEITGPNSWARLCRQYPLEVTALRRRDWFDTTGRDGRWVIPDFSAVARDYAGVHLSIAGYLATAGEVVPVDEHTASLIAGWDPDATYWLRDETALVGQAQRWVLDDAGPGPDDWVRVRSSG